jgi:predicted DNA-binding antitoxin AbrB/MazE fold protein
MNEQKFEAVYEDRVFKPLAPISLAPGTSVTISISQDDKAFSQTEAVDRKVFEILSRRHNSGQFDVAARHNDHQP